MLFLNISFLPEFCLLIYFLIILIFIIFKKKIILKKIYITRLLNQKFIYLLYGFSFFYIYILIYKYNYSINLFLINTKYICFLKLLVITTTLFILRYFSQQLILKKYHFDYILLFTSILFFILIFLSSFDFLILFITLIGFSICTYTLIIKEKMIEKTQQKIQLLLEASFKYFYFSTLSSVFIILSIFLFYLKFKTLNFWKIQQLNIFNIIYFDFFFNKYILNELLFFCLLFLIIGFLFKFANFPFHFWVSEVYVGIQTITLLIFILPLKIANLGLFCYIINVILLTILNNWQFLLALIAVISILVGCLLAYTALSIRKFIATTSINQIGFILLTIAIGTFESMQAFLLYLFIYIIMNMLFLSIYIYISSKKYQIIYIFDLKLIRKFGYVDKLIYSLFLALIFFSMAGIPPLAGFFSKYYILLTLFQTKFIYTTITVLFISIISCCYYLYIIKELLLSNITSKKAKFGFITQIKKQTFLFYGINFLIFFIFIIDFILIFIQQLIFLLIKNFKNIILIFNQDL